MRPIEMPDGRLADLVVVTSTEDPDVSLATVFARESEEVLAEIWMRRPSPLSPLGITLLAHRISAGRGR